MKYRIKKVVKEYTLCGGGVDITWEVQKKLFWKFYYVVAIYGSKKLAVDHLEYLYTNDCRD